MVVLAVCPVHLAAVTEWARPRSVSDGMAVDIEGLNDFRRLVNINSRIATKKDPLRCDYVSNLEGGVTLLAS